MILKRFDCIRYNEESILVEFSCVLYMYADDYSTGIIANISNESATIINY